MDQVPKLSMSYWANYRRLKASVAEFFGEGGSSISREENEENGQSTCDDYNFSLQSRLDEVSGNEVDLNSGSDSRSESECSDSDVSVDDCATVNDDILNEQLAQWATNCEVPFVTVNLLLSILRPFHKNLPADCRTLVHTPRKSDIRELRGGGEYVHFGIRRNIEDLVNKGHLKTDNILELQFNIDGLPLFKSSSLSIWPILCMVRQSISTGPFAVGIFSGGSKPKNLEAYLEEFVAEVTHIVKNGLSISGANFAVNIHSFVCDAPARSFLKNVKGHSGYFGCDKCKQEGEYHGKLTFPETTAAARTDDEFDRMQDTEHH
jgi:hypothetical protein